MRLGRSDRQPCAGVLVLIFVVPALALYACLSSLAVLILVGAVKAIDQKRKAAEAEIESFRRANQSLGRENDALWRMLAQQNQWIADNMRHMLH